MKSSGRAQKTIHRARVIALTTILSAYAGCSHRAPDRASSELTEQNWRTQIVQVPLAKKGCFTATYPSLQWREVACVAPPPPNVRFTVGSSFGDYAAVRALPLTGVINSATGSFPTETGVKSESDSLSGVADAYTLQLNTNYFFTTTSVDPVCPTANPQCKGFQQFIFENTNGNAFMEYFLSVPGAMSCPTGWSQVPSIFTGYISCTVFSPMAVHFGSQPITNLQSLTLTGTATAGGNDTAFVGMGGMMSAVNTDSVLNVASGWVDAEFNVFGACCSSQAIFNSNSTIDVETTIHYGGTVAPGCYMRSYTAETNNLSLVGAPVFGTQPSPAIEFTESNKTGGTAACAAAAGTGDTHLRTFSGLLYDFQAAGDFLLTQAKDFQVQTRQVSGAPTWANASVNHAVATQMGKTRVALCAAARGPLVVDGHHTDLADGHTLKLPSGVHVFRTGDVYLVTDHNGNSLRAVMNSTTTTSWIDVSVGLSTWPTPVRGLLANANDNLNELAASDGIVFNTPVAFADLYGRYGESWRVAPAHSLLAACGGRASEHSMPSQPFLARDLALKAPKIYAQARAICTNAGVKVPALLDACTLDVAVIGSEKAATVYVGVPAPAAVSEAGKTTSD
jgi:hypothetical protein